MNPGLNILDQLLMPTGEGVLDNMQRTHPAETGEVNPFAVLFNELFGQAGTVASDGQTTKTSEQPAGQAATVAMPAMVEMLPTTDLPKTEVTAGDQPSILPDPKLVCPQVDQADNTALMPTDDSLKLPDNFPVTNESLRRILQEVPVDLKTGTFEVESAQLSDSKITLSVRTNETGQKVKITLPSQVLSDLKQIVAGKRVDLDGVSGTEQRVRQMLADMNLKQLEISQSTEVEATTVDNQKPVTVTLIAENNGQALEIKNRLMPHRITAVENRASAADGLAPDKATEINENYQPQNNAARKDCLVLRPAQPQSAPVTPERNTPQFAGANHQLHNEAVIDPGAVDIAARATEVATTATARTQAHSVRFDLPDQLGQTLKPNGQSVMIRIQPDHLGPAQLRLTLHRDTIKATLTVDTHEAKALIEGSLDKLSQQLHRANIKFDQINVNVSSDDLRDQLFNRQPDWSRRPQFINEKIDTQALTSTEIPAAMPIFEQARVTSTGVNVLA